MTEERNRNIFDLENTSLSEFEIFQALAETDHALVERIISKGQKTPDGQWLEQERTEWVILLQGKAGLCFEDGTERNLIAGDYVLIPGNTRHRVTYTSTEPSCIWLAFHFE